MFNLWHETEICPLDMDTFNNFGSVIGSFVLIKQTKALASRHRASE